MLEINFVNTLNPLLSVWKDNILSLMTMVVLMGQTLMLSTKDY